MRVTMSGVGTWDHVAETPSERHSVRLAFDWAARSSTKWRPSPSQTPFWHGTEG
jgi:hypothetical protein